jgi:hypothetical protein
MSKTMSALPRSILCSLWTFLLCTHAVQVSGQSTTSQQAQCFSIRVQLNGKAVEGPQTITLKTKRTESTVSRKGNCFRVPADILAQGKIDVAFAIPGNRVYLSAIDASFLSNSWDIELEDKKFTSEVVLPKHARVKRTCAVTFHVGEPEIQMSQTACRTPIP